jgi:DNA repair photolyase
MGGKPVVYRDAKTVLTLKAEEFHEKHLCDGIVLNLGDACVYGCEFCYVEASMRKIDTPFLEAYNSKAKTEYKFEDVVIRRKNAIQLLKSQLFDPKGKPKFDDPMDTRVVFSSTLVDVAANMELLRETAEACNLLLDHTHFQIRLLSKSNLLHKLIADKMIPERHHQRIIFGFSTGTLDDRVAKAIETGTPLVSKRLESLHWLQDRGLRTFGMICPSLPQHDYRKFSREICEAIRFEQCEHVWAEVINVRGASLTKTLEGLRRNGLDDEAAMMEEVSGPEATARWEKYARDTFQAHAANVPPEKLRFLQYIAKGTEDWWEPKRESGAVLIGTSAKELTLTTTPTASAAPLSVSDREYLDERELMVTSGIRAGIAASRALFEIHSYKDGILWRSAFPTFEAYCRSNWEYGKSHSYRLVECGGFVNDLASQSPNGDSDAWMPRSEAHVRPLLALPKEERVGCWKEIVAETPPAELTGRQVSKLAKQHGGNGGVAEKPAPAKESARTRRAHAVAALQRLELAVQNLSGSEEIKTLLRRIETMIGESR